MHHPIQMKPADSENRNGKRSSYLFCFTFCIFYGDFLSCSSAFFDSFDFDSPAIFARAFIERKAQGVSNTKKSSALWLFSDVNCFCSQFSEKCCCCCCCWFFFPHLLFIRAHRAPSRWGMCVYYFTRKFRRQLTLWKIANYYSNRKCLKCVYLRAASACCWWLLSRKFFA